MSSNNLWWTLYPYAIFLTVFTGCFYWTSVMYRWWQIISIGNRFSSWELVGGLRNGGLSFSQRTNGNPDTKPAIFCRGTHGLTWAPCKVGVGHKWPPIPGVHMNYVISQLLYQRADISKTVPKFPGFRNFVGPVWTMIDHKAREKTKMASITRNAHDLSWYSSSTTRSLNNSRGHILIIGVNEV